jgi:uncharacterized SAM-dependent methyltransferase
VNYFETRFLEQANECIETLAKKSAGKIFYNIDLAEQTIQNFLKNYKAKFENLEVNILVITFEFSLFGTKPKN